jgi:ABC-type lipopolysaccharide export system ATPase subunit
MVVIETEGLTKLYGKARGIEDVTFSVGAGEVFGFLGPNGAARRRRFAPCSTCCTVAAVVMAPIGAWLFERRDLSA